MTQNRSSIHDRVGKAGSRKNQSTLSEIPVVLALEMVGAVHGSCIRTEVIKKTLHNGQHRRREWLEAGRRWVQKEARGRALDQALVKSKALTGEA